VILADSSAWVELDRATGSPVHLRLRSLIAADGPLAVTEPVLMEVLAGAHDEAAEHRLRRLLLRHHLLAVDPTSDLEAAAQLYRRCRRTGVTPRGLLDCLIAAVAWRNDATLLARDVDLQRVAAVAGIRMDAAGAP
jgi:predicted nucleic acid-binding protein